MRLPMMVMRSPVRDVGVLLSDDRRHEWQRSEEDE
jgi:hypothetical protein